MLSARSGEAPLCHGGYPLSSFGNWRGVPTAILLGRYVASQLYGIKPNDPWVVGTSMLLPILVACLAGLIPACRASRIDPILALRCE